MTSLSLVARRARAARSRYRIRARGERTKPPLQHGARVGARGFLGAGATGASLPRGTLLSSDRALDGGVLATGRDGGSDVSHRTVLVLEERRLRPPSSIASSSARSKTPSPARTRSLSKNPVGPGRPLLPRLRGRTPERLPRFGRVQLLQRLSGGEAGEGATTRGFFGIDPSYADACLLPGIFEYTLATLPRSLRILGFVIGIRGSKEKGLALVERAVAGGERTRWVARLSLSVMQQREKRYLSSLDMLRELEQAFPQNPFSRWSAGASIC